VTAVRTVAIVGGGQAASVATRTLRRRGYDGSIAIFGDEPHRPYQRPPLSKEYLAEGDGSGLFLLPEDWTTTHDVDVHTSARVMALDAGAGRLVLEDGTTAQADAILLATGGRPRRLPGVEGSRVHYLRTKADADSLRASIGPGARVVIVGAGFIGAEVASSALSLGADVTVIEAAGVPLQRVLGEQLGAVCAGIQRDANVDLRTGVAVNEVREEGENVVVDTSDGPIVGDVAVVAIGIVPNQELAEASGLVVGNGIHVDEYCRTSVPSVYAAGDVANQLHPLLGVRLRVEHFDNASKQAAVAANNILGRHTRSEDPHWFWSDQFGVNLQCVGHPSDDDEVILRGDLESRDFTAFFLHEGKIRAAFSMNRGDDIAVARELITMGASVPSASLADTDMDLFDALEMA
jgi:3-phenylpropionate/trans-cinnamate dioxygenase ferredoxin reductase subunit